jgi:hypothetical protein
MTHKIGYGKPPSRKGIILSETIKEKISNGVKNHLPKTAFQKGYIPWNKGKEFLMMKENKYRLGFPAWNKGKSMFHSGSFKKLEKHPNWKGGKSFEKWGKNFTEIFKEAIKLRDHACVICGSENRLQVHHIDYNKLNTIKENCITLCISCHMKTNFNRKQWTSFFQSLLKERYNYNVICVIE